VEFLSGFTAPLWSRAPPSLPASCLFAWIYNGLIPHAKRMKSIELFATQVLPRFAVDE
jgi:hypothetical protein